MVPGKADPPPAPFLPTKKKFPDAWSVLPGPQTPSLAWTSGEVRCRGSVAGCSRTSQQALGICRAPEGTDGSSSGQYRTGSTHTAHRLLRSRTCSVPELSGDTPPS